MRTISMWRLMDIHQLNPIFDPMNLLIRFLLSGVAVMLTAYLLPGVHVTDYWAALLVAALVSFSNLVIRPLFILLTIPITILTLGLFLLVINAMIILGVDYFVDDFQVDGFWWALAFSLILSIFNSLFTDSLPSITFVVSGWLADD
jgi:putative membrane protein